MGPIVAMTVAEARAELDQAKVTLGDIRVIHALELLRLEKDVRACWQRQNQGILPQGDLDALNVFDLRRRLAQLRHLGARRGLR